MAKRTRDEIWARRMIIEVQDIAVARAGGLTAWGFLGPSIREALIYQAAWGLVNGLDEDTNGVLAKVNALTALICEVTR